MFHELVLRFGRSSSAQPLKLELAPITIFVGPNNSGKSKILTEIQQFCHQGTSNAQSQILENLKFNENDADTANAELLSLEIKFEGMQVGQTFLGRGPRHVQVKKDSWLQIIAKPNSNPGYYAQHYLQLVTLKLDGASRMQIINSQQAGNLKQPPQNVFQSLILSDSKRKQIRKILLDAFNKFFVIDPTNIGHLELRFSDVEPPSDSIERGWSEESVAFHSKATPVSQFSDGVKAYTGIITEIVAGDPRVLLIDEPEAFLHPALATSLGKEISKTIGSSTEKQLFASTHSPNFLMGCIQASSKANIVRLTYRSGQATARVLPKEKLTVLMRDPLLRSIGALSGLFYEAVIVTEGDTDRAFYQEINDRLIEYKSEWGIPNCLFLNAQNKQTLHKIIKPLRDLGIPVAGIVDVDIFKNKGMEFARFLRGANIPLPETKPLSEIRASCLRELEASGRNMKRDGGIDLLSGDAKEAANNLCDRLSEYGLFVVRHGELENWMSYLGVTGQKAEWLVKIFEKMGSDPARSDYSKPTDGDVWKFMYLIKNWVLNPSRKGIPS